MIPVGMTLAMLARAILITTGGTHDEKGAASAGELAGADPPGAARRVLPEGRRGRGQDMGTWRRILPSMRSNISGRLRPVMVRPWFLSPITAQAGSGLLFTSPATALASS